MVGVMVGFGVAVAVGKLVAVAARTTAGGGVAVAVAWRQAAKPNKKITPHSTGNVFWRIGSPVGGKAVLGHYKKIITQSFIKRKASQREAAR
jgi:hypothetical protein